MPKTKYIFSKSWSAAFMAFKDNDGDSDALIQSKYKIEQEGQ